MIAKLPEPGNEMGINWIFTSNGNNENIHIKVDLLKLTPTIKDTIYRKKFIFSATILFKFLLYFYFC
jgi:hypothetical protein